jgi:diguanylate cyclase (GGDEF)-like protein
MSKRPLFNRLLIGYGILTAFILMTLVVISFSGQVDIINENTLIRIINNNHVVNNFLQEPDFNLNNFKDFLTSREIGDYVLIDNDNFYSVLDERNLTDKDFEMINLALAKISYGTDFFSYYIEDEKIYSYIPFVWEGRDFSFKIYGDFSDSRDRLNDIFRVVGIAGIFILIANFIFVSSFYRKFFNRLQKIEDASVKILDGEYDVFVKDKEEDELNKLIRSFNMMAGTINEQIEHAQKANPLSGLPGNITIENEMEERLEKEEDFAILYIDLDNFKSYNDKYGFQRGDDVILYARDKMQSVAEIFPEESKIFLGHEGGDDYVIIMRGEDALAYAEKFISSFDSSVEKFYNEHDKRQGFILSTDRDGNRKKFEFVACSIAVVYGQGKESTTEIVESASKVKKKVKGRDARKGSAFVVE